jgi:hypothetical protein
LRVSSNIIELDINELEVKGVLKLPTAAANAIMLVRPDGVCFELLP